MSSEGQMKHRKEPSPPPSKSGLRSNPIRHAAGVPNKAAQKKSLPKEALPEWIFGYDLTLNDSERVVITPQSFSSFSPIDLADWHFF